MGVLLYADTEGELSEPMLDRMLRILVEELTTLDVDTHISCPPGDIEPYQWPDWVPPSA